MGDAADSALEYYMNNHIGFGWGGTKRRRGFQSGSGKGMWRTASGAVLDMRDMETAHLVNAMRKCMETFNTGKAADIQAELDRRGYTAPAKPADDFPVVE